MGLPPAKRLQNERYWVVGEPEPEPEPEPERECPSPNPTITLTLTLTLTLTARTRTLVTYSPGLNAILVVVLRRLAILF